MTVSASLYPGKLAAMSLDWVKLYPTLTGKAENTAFWQKLIKEKIQGLMMPSAMLLGDCGVVSCVYEIKKNN